MRTSQEIYSGIVNDWMGSGTAWRPEYLLPIFEYISGISKVLDYENYYFSGTSSPAIISGDSTLNYTMGNLGAGTGVFGSKVNSYFGLKSLISGNGINISSDSNTITISLSSLSSTSGTPGPQGPQGLSGIQGIQGIQGQQGLSGIQGIQGTQGLSGIQGVQGLQGLSGVPGTIQSFLAPLILNGLTVSGLFASNINSGFLSSFDWTNFNSKSNFSSPSGNLSSVGTWLSVLNGNNSVLGNGTTLALTIPFVGQNSSGVLSSGNWSDFNNKISTASNLGAGTGIYTSTTGTVLNFKSLISGNGVQITSDANTITISSNASGGANNTFNAPLFLNGTIVSGSFATANQSGFLTANDWNNFNNKLSSTLSGIILSVTRSGFIAPAREEINLHGQSVGGRMLLAKESSFGNEIIAPAMFDTTQVIITPNTTTSVNVIGTSVTSVGTLSHPAPNGTMGRFTNFAAAATTNSTAGTGTEIALFQIGSGVPVNSYGGFFGVFQIGFPDTTLIYSGTIIQSGSRAFVGFTDQTMAASVGLDNPAGRRAGFSYISSGVGGNQTTWFFSTKDNVTESRVNTNLPFTGDSVYRFYIYAPKASTNIYWEAQNLMNDTYVSGVTSSNLPTSNIFLRGGFQIQKLSSSARNIAMDRVYLEANR